MADQKAMNRSVRLIIVGAIIWILGMGAARLLDSALQPAVDRTIGQATSILVLYIIGLCGLAWFIGGLVRLLIAAARS